MRLAFALVILLCTAVAPGWARAQGSEDDAAGWGDLSPAATAPAEQAAHTAADEPPAQPLNVNERESPKSSARALGLSLAGFVREDFAMGGQGLMLARSTLEAAAELRSRVLTLHVGGHAELDPVYLMDRSRFDEPTRDTYKAWVLPWEAYLALHGRGVVFSAGRQIVAWGNALLVPALDLPNPRDQRMPGLGEPAGQRVPLTMTRLALDRGAHRAELLAIHEADYRPRPAPYAPYSPLPKLLTDAQGEGGGLAALAQGREFEYRHDVARFSRAAQQLLGRYRYVGSRLELGLHAGYLPHGEGAMRLPALSDWAGKRVAFPVEHPRYTALGASLLGTRGDFVGFVDTLVELRRPVSVGELQGLPRVEITRQSWSRYVLGLRYAGLESGFIALEQSMGFRLDAQNASELRPILPVAPPVLAAIYQQRFARERVEVELTASAFGPRLRGGGVARARFSLRPRDALTITLAYVLFVPGSEPSLIAGFTSHDRVDLSMRWDFAAERPR